MRKSRNFIYNRIWSLVIPKCEIVFWPMIIKEYETNDCYDISDIFYAKIISEFTVLFSHSILETIECNYPRL